MNSLGMGQEVVNIAAALVTGEALPDDALSPLERIIAQSQLISSIFLSLGAERMRAVGRIITESGRGFGTGFLISPRLLMTNNHVLDSSSLAARCRAQFDFVRGVDGTIGTTQVFRLLPNEFFVTADTSGAVNLDYTIVAVESVNTDGKTLASRGSIPLIATSGKLVKGDLANIIQHPGGEAQQVAIRDSQVVGPLEHFIRYEADTQPGSSGSPVFNDLWQVAALHHSGVPEIVRPGVYRLIDGGEWDTRVALSREDQLRMAARVKWIANEGVRISSIVSDVQKRLRDDPTKLALFLEAVREQIRPIESVIPPVGNATSLLSSRPAPGEGFTGGHSVTWTVPLHVTVQLGPDIQLSVGTGGASGAASIPVVIDTQRPSVPVSAPTGNADAAAAKARASLADIREVLEVRAGFLWRDGEMTDTEAVVVALDPNAPILADPHEALSIPREIDGVPVDVTLGGATALFRAMEGEGGLAEEAVTLADLLQEAMPAITYRSPTDVQLDEVNAAMEVTCHVSPDDGWPVLEEFLGRTDREITLGMFDLTAPHIDAKLKELAERPGFHLNLAIQRGMAGGLEGVKKNDTPEDDVIRDLSALMGDRFRQVFVDVTGPDRTFASAYHIKVAVRDHQEFWLSSGNMQTSNQPKISPFADGETTFKPLNTFNREWHVVIKNKKLATVFEKFLLHDIKTGEDNPAEPPKPQDEVLIPVVPVDPSLLEADREPKYFARKVFPRDTTAPVRIQPLLTPDNFLDHVIPLVKSARERLFIQNQSLSILQPLDKNEEAFLNLFRAIRERQERRHRRTTDLQGTL